MNKIYIIIIGALLLVSCSVGKEYSRTQIETPASFRTASGNTSTLDTNHITLMHWKEFFSDVALQQIIDSVLKRNYDKLVALNNIQLNEQYLKQAKVAWLPNVTATISAGSNRFSDNSLNGENGFNLNKTIGSHHLDDYSANLGVSWEIDIWGKIRKQKEVALVSYLQSQEASKALQTRLIAATASAYYNLSMLHKQLDIARKNLALNDSTVKMIRIQTENGEATTLALQQAEIQQKSTASLIPDLEQALMIQENALNLLMGQHAESINMGDGLDRFTIPEKFETGIPVQLLNRRPDVREREYALRTANARMGIAQANMYPALSINVAGGINSFQFSNWMTLPASLFGNVLGNIVQPVFNKRKLKTQLNISRIEYEQAVTYFRKQVVSAATEVSDALITSEKLKQKMEIIHSQNHILQLAVPNARLLYFNGKANYLEVIAAQQSLLQNELGLANLKRQQVSAYIELYRTLGGGIE
ncbi:Outer membrane protein OprM precursor [compost metagenome]